MNIPSTSLVTARIADADLDDWTVVAQHWLNPTELERAARMAPGARARHVAGRALIKLTAAKRFGLQPAGVEVSVTALGKPVAPGLPDFHFSVAHCAGLVVVGCCVGVEIGVDVESPDRPSPQRWARVADRFFAPAEAQALRALGTEDADRAFLRHWTLKEAVGKASGEGVGDALSGAVFEARVGQPARLLSSWAGLAADQWTLHELTAPGGQELIAVALPQPEVSAPDVHSVDLNALRAGSLT